MLKEVHGRALNTLCETYMLPADEQEFIHHDRVHDMWKVHFDGGLCINQIALEDVLGPPNFSATRRKSVLDLGFGSGAWLRDMANKYPWVDFTGVDLTPRGSGSVPVPSNVTLELDDINLGLTHWVNQFDVVHVRCIAMGVHDYQKLIKEIYQILRPNGLVFLTELDMELFQDNGEILSPAFEDKSRGSWLARILFEAYQTCRRSGAAMEAGLMHERWLRNTPGFTSVRIEKVYHPIGPWMTSHDSYEARRFREVGTLMQENTRDLVTSLRPLLLNDGFFEEHVNQMMDKALQEISSGSLPHGGGMRVFTKWNCASARKH